MTSERTMRPSPPDRLPRPPHHAEPTADTSAEAEVAAKAEVEEQQGKAEVEEQHTGSRRTATAGTETRS